MTLSKVIEQFDSERANGLSLEAKIRWISQLDMKIFDEILKARGDKAFKGYDVTTPFETVVKAPDEYSEVYILYLNMKLDLLNGEIARHNNSAMLFNMMYSDMHDSINRESPVPVKNTIKAGKYYV